MSLPTQLQEYIHKSRYARWLTTENRREHWEETVQRYVDYFDSKFPHFPKEEIKNAILNLKTMPSMRALMTAGPALERDPIAGFNPVAGDTLVVTKELGNVPIKTLAGKSATVLNKNGDWTPATFKSYGVQPVTKVTLKLNSNTVKEVFATANHRWVLSDGTVVPTSALEQGNHIDFVTAPKAQEDADYILGIRHGLVYGDGAMTKAHKRVKGYHLRLCGTAKQDFLKYFTEYPIAYPPSAEGDPIIMLYDTFAATHALKELPSAQETDSYLLGFIRGWFGADGHVGKKNPQVSICCNAAGRDWLLQYSERAGFVIQSISTQPRTTNYGERTEDSFVLRISRSSFTEADVLSAEKQALVKPIQSCYSVYSVEETGEAEEVFCAEVPVTNTFVLAGGLVTGNCSFVAIDDPRAFDEILYILMCGTGVGFSVERQYIAQLPVIGLSIGFDNDGNPQIESRDHLTNIDYTIVVEDSKAGWATAFKNLLKFLYAGEIPKWDVSLVRPAGAKLVTFGGRASGPDPLVDLFKFTIETFKQACGRKLTSIECHDLVCKIADIVVVGGVRRSALISLSNLSDDRMRLAKSGQWWINDPQRALANNSATYTERPQTEIFLKEWMSLIESKSGERGIFNKHAAIKKAESTGRRDASKIAGTNPCFAAGTLIHTTIGAFPIETLVGKTVTVWDGKRNATISNFRVTGENAETLLLTLQDGSQVKATPYHSFYLEDGTKVEMKGLLPGMRLQISNAPMAQGHQHTESAYLKGFLIGDGTLGNENPLLWLYDTKYACKDRLSASAQEVPSSDVDFVNAGENRNRMQGIAKRTDLTAWCKAYKTGLPVEIYSWSNQHKYDFIAGLFDSDGCAINSKNGFGYQLTSVSKQLLLDVQTLLKTFGVFGKVSLNKIASTADFNDGYGEYDTQALYRLSIGQESAIELSKQVTFERLESFAHRTMTYKLKPRWNAIVDIQPATVEDKVYCCTVPDSHKVSLAIGITTGQCAEISLRSAGLCNLSEVVIRSTDTLDDLKYKVHIATIIGTYQSLLTDFKYIRPIWKQNQEDERLLGVSLTGIMDHPVLSVTGKPTAYWLNEMKQQAIKTNADFARLLGIKPAAAITTVKPSGTVSQLVDSASGIHPRYSKHYIRTVRADKKDPLAQLMVSQGFPVEDAFGKEDSTYVFSFPVEGPPSGVYRDDRTAIQQLEHYLMYQKHWSEHNVSNTIYVKEDEWLEVGAWVFKNFDDLAGVSFLPHSNHSYKQAPYQECTEAEYKALLATMPSFDWDALSEFEKDDATVNTKEYACTSGVCEII